MGAQTGVACRLGLVWSSMHACKRWGVVGYGTPYAFALELKKKKLLVQSRSSLPCQFIVAYCLSESEKSILHASSFDLQELILLRSGLSIGISYLLKQFEGV